MRGRRFAAPRGAVGAAHAWSASSTSRARCTATRTSRSRSSSSSTSQVVRVDLYWGGAKYAVAQAPADERQGSRRSRVRLVALRPHGELRGAVRDQAALHGLGDAALGERRQGATATRRRTSTDLRNFAYAAAKRYSGTWLAADGRPLPAVRLWTAWNEPNQPFQLSPQYRKVARQVRDAERDRLREDLHRDLHRRPRDAAQGREGRRAASRPRRATTTRPASGRFRRRSPSCRP